MEQEKQTPAINNPQPKSSLSALDLIQWVQKSDNSSLSAKWANQDINSAQEMRFLSVRYKVYSFIAVVILLLISGPVQVAVQDSLSRWDNLQNITNRINAVINNQQKYEDEKKLFEAITSNKDAIVSCINQSSRCDELSEDITSNIETIKAYLQLWTLQRDKMEIDEAKILKSINEYMLQKNILWWSRVYNGVVTSISIGSPTIIENNIIKAPLSLLISFDKKEDLLSFLNNVENYIYVDPQEWTNSSILFRIEELKYDIVNYKESQDVEVSLSAYAYNWQ